jgi:uncharacterized membrane protein
MNCLSHDCDRARALAVARPNFSHWADIVTVGIGLFILLPMLRVIVMLIFFLKERDYEFAAASFPVLLIIFSGFAIGTLPK